MALPDLRHFRNEGLFTISSDPVEALAGEAWLPAIYTDKGWTTADGASLLLGIEEWRYAAKEGQITADDLGKHQDGDESRQAPKASRSNRARQSRQVTQAEG
jgi:hypothetical protein